MEVLILENLPPVFVNDPNNLEFKEGDGIQRVELPPFYDPNDEIVEVVAEMDNAAPFARLEQTELVFDLQDPAALPGLYEIFIILLDGYNKSHYSIEVDI